MSVKDELIGAKGGSGTFRSSPDNLRSTDTFEALIGLCSGRIKGLAPGGLQNLFVDDVPIEDGSGNTTLSDFSAVLSDGDPAVLRPVTLQLGGSSGAQTVNLPVNNANQATGTGTPGEWRYGTVPQSGVDYIDIRFVVQSLYRQDKNGIYNATASLEIELQPSGSSQWINPLASTAAPTYNQNGIKLTTAQILYAVASKWANGTTWSASSNPGYLAITGKTTQAYVKELRIAVPNTGNYANKTWQVRVRLRERDSYTKDQDSESRAITWESVAGVSMAPLGDREEWRGLAYLQINGKASDQLSGVPTITGIYDLSMVRVPPSSVWDANTRIYTGQTWDGATEEIQWTQCPAFQMKDLIEDSVSGISALTPGCTLNKWDALEASKWFAQQVPDGQGGTHPRYSMNYILDSALSVNDLMQYVAGAVGSYAWDEGDVNWRLVVEKPENATALFTKESIVGEFNYSHTDIDSRMNDMIGVFRNEARGFEEDRVRVFDQAHIDNYGRRATSVALVGCSTRQEALRRIKIRQLASLNETRQVSFATNRQGNLVQPFSVILVADGDLASDTSVRTTGRLMSRTDSVLTVRDTLRLEVGIDYKVHVTIPNPAYNPSSTAQPGSPDWRKPTITVSRAITNTATTRGDVTTLNIDSPLPANTPANAQIALEAVGLPTLPKQYRVIDVEPQDDELVTINAIEIYTNKWNESDNVNEDTILAQRPNKVIPSPLTPADGRMFSVQSFEAEYQTKRVMTVRWDRPGSIWIDGFKVEFNLNSGPWQSLTEKTQDNYVELQQPQNGIYTFRITTIDRRGGTSNPLVGTYTLDDTANDYAPVQTIGRLQDRPSTGSREGDKYTTNDQNPNLTYIWSNGQWLAESNFVTDATQISYIDPVTGKTTVPVQSLQPAQAGADVTGANTAKDTKNVNGRDASTVLTQIDVATGNIASAVQQIGDIIVDVDALTTTYGTTANAQTSANVATQAAQTATSALTDAKTARDAAKTAQGLAAGSATAADTARANAVTAYNNAVTAQNNSQTAATNAATSATNAGGSATAAATSATAAGTSATNAGNSATAASNSSVSAASNAGYAGNYATNNLISKSAFDDSALGQWTNATAVADAGPTGLGHTKVLRGGTGGTDSKDGVAKTGNWASRKIRCQGWVKNPSSAASVGVGVIGTRTSGGAVNNYIAVSTTTDWTQFDVVVTTDASFATGVPFVRANSPNGVLWTDLVWTDITESTASAGSATAAAGSASTASTQATNAGQSATAASTSATNASTSAGNAQTYANNASTSAGNAAGSASTAQTQAGVATTARQDAQTARDVALGYKNDANASATAAAGSANTATSKATDAGNSATSASGFANTAQTQAINASNYAQAASDSATAAASSSTVAGQSASAASSASVSASLTSALLLPSTFMTNTDWTNSRSGDPATVPPITNLIFGNNDPDFGYYVLNNSGFRNGAKWLCTRGTVPLVAGRTYRLTRTIKANTGGDQVSVNAVTLDATFTEVGLTEFEYNALYSAGTINTRAYDVNCDVILAANPTARSLRFAVNATRSTTYGQLLVEDVTQALAATASANAASNSANSAAISQTQAGNSASAAQTSEVNAGTSANNAGTSANNANTYAGNASASASAAATSASNASGSANTASTQAGLAANSANAASGSAGAASTSASTASSKSDAAGNSASAANASAIAAHTSEVNASASAGVASTAAVSATSSASSATTSQTLTAAIAGGMTPDRFDANGSFFFASNTNATDYPWGGAPETHTMAASDIARIVTRPGYGYAFTMVDQRYVLPRGAIRIIADHVYEIEAEWEVANYGSTISARIYPMGLDAAYTDITYGTYSMNLTANGVFTQSYRFSKTPQTGVNTLNTSMVFLRPQVRYVGGTGTVYLRRLTIRDVTADINTGTLSARVATTESVTATLTGRTQAYFQKVAVAGAATAFISAQAQDNNGTYTSNVGIGAATISLYNQTSGGFKLAMQLSGGNAVFTGSLNVGATIRLGTGQGWPVALQARDFNVADNSAINFGTDLGNVPDYSFRLNNLSPLNSGETYNIYLDGLTSTTATLRAKIITPATAVSYNLTSPTAPGSGPTSQMEKGSAVESSDGTYNLAVTISGSAYVSYSNA